MKDRIPKYAGRVKLNPVPNQPNTYDMERADEPLQEGTPLNKNTLLSDDIALKMGLKDDDTPNDALQSLFEKGNNILKKGKGDHGIEQVSENNTNQALTENTIALGEGCISGCKGYYITGIFFGNEQYYPQVRISNVQPNSIDILKNPFSANSSFTAPDYKVNDKIYINCGNHYIDLYKINWISTNILILYPDSNHSLTKLREGLEKTAREGNATITGDLSPSSARSSFKLLGDLKFDDYTLSVPTRPEVGVVEVSKNGFASGEGTKATATDSTSEGRENHSVGPYGHTEGRGNKAGYAAHAQNAFNEALHHYSDVGGFHNGSSREIQFVRGWWAKENPDAIAIFGNGTSEENRSNAFEVLDDGNVTINGRVFSGLVTGSVTAAEEDKLTLYFDTIPNMIFMASESECLIVFPNYNFLIGMSLETDFPEFRQGNIIGYTGYARVSENAVTLSAPTWAVGRQFDYVAF